VLTSVADPDPPGPKAFYSSVPGSGLEMTLPEESRFRSESKIIIEDKDSWKTNAVMKTSFST